jgi:beta-glucuronidase
MDDDEIAGFYIWQYSDIRSNCGKLIMGRPRSFNNKGIVNEYRKPKMAYWEVKRILESHIGKK